MEKFKGLNNNLYTPDVDDIEDIDIVPGVDVEIDEENSFGEVSAEESEDDPDEIADMDFFDDTNDF